MGQQALVLEQQKQIARISTQLVKLSSMLTSTSVTIAAPPQSALFLNTCPVNYTDDCASCKSFMLQCYFIQELEEAWQRRLSWSTCWQMRLSPGLLPSVTKSTPPPINASWSSFGKGKKVGEHPSSISPSIFNYSSSDKATKVPPNLR